MTGKCRNCGGALTTTLLGEPEFCGVECYNTHNRTNG